MSRIVNAIKDKIKVLVTRHVPSGQPNVFIHSLPRSGSTWLMELILTQPGFLACNEPLNLRKDVVQDYLGIRQWADLHNSRNKDTLYVYFDGLTSGRIRDARFLFHRRDPWSRFYRPLTTRIVYKIINAGEEYINWLSDTFNGRIVYLLRHPAPVSLSRKYFPKLDTILDSDFRERFDAEQLAFAKEVLRRDDAFAHGMLDWCLRNFVALSTRRANWAVLTYEQLVLDPIPVVHYLSERLALPKPHRILKRLQVPSNSTKLSDQRTQEALRTDHGEGRRQWLVEKWQSSVNPEQITLTQELLDAFSLSHIYSASEALPKDEFWIRPQKQAKV